MSAREEAKVGLVVRLIPEGNYNGKLAALRSIVWCHETHRRCDPTAATKHTGSSRLHGVGVATRVMILHRSISHAISQSLTQASNCS